MLAKAIIATLLGAGVTGGAVYFAANPDVLEPKAKAERTVIKDADAPKSDVMPVKSETRDAQPIETAPVTPAPKSVPVLPEAKQLTERTVIMPASDTPKSNDQDNDDIISGADDTHNFDENTTADTPDSVDDDLNRIMTQAARMDSPDLRDQAHLSAVEFALNSGNFDGASRAMEMLSQPQLRDTARSKIAVKYARSGQTDMAFEIIDAVEIDDLRDFMRLQVIEVITAGP